MINWRLETSKSHMPGGCDVAWPGLFLGGAQAAFRSQPAVQPESESGGRWRAGGFPGLGKPSALLREGACRGRAVRHGGCRHYVDSRVPLDILVPS